MYSKVLAAGLSFNDNFHYGITAVRGLGFPPVRRASSEVAGEHFGIPETALYAPRQFSLSGIIVGTSVADLEQRREAFADAFDIRSTAFKRQRFTKSSLTMHSGSAY